MTRRPVESICACLGTVAQTMALSVQDDEQESNDVLAMREESQRFNAPFTFV